MCPPEKGRGLKVDGDDNVGMKVVADHIGGQVIQDAAVDQVVAVVGLDGRKNTGNGDGGANGQRQRAVVKGDRLQVFRSVATQRKGIGMRSKFRS